MARTKKNVKAYNRARFGSLKDAFLAAAHMRSIICDYVFKDFSKKIAKVVEHEIVYTTVIFAPLKDAQVGRARMGPVIGFYLLKDFSKVCKM